MLKSTHKEKGEPVQFLKMNTRVKILENVKNMKSENKTLSGMC